MTHSSRLKTADLFEDLSFWALAGCFLEKGPIVLTQQLKPQRIRATGVRPGKPELIWSSRASRSRHPDFGLRRQWVETQRLYAIVQFPESTGEFIAMCGPVSIARKRSLARAKRACLNHFTSHPGA